jgi:RNA polymerase sigma-70 factor (ECF subfamily)
MFDAADHHARVHEDPAGLHREGHEPRDDEGLAARVARGDQAAFMAIYDQYGDMIFATALRFFRDRDAAAEIVQETMLAVWRRIGQFDAAHGSLGAWMLAIARNRSIDRLRADARRPKIVRPADDADETDAVDALSWAGRPVLAADADEPGSEIDRRWVRAILTSTLAEIRPEERTVLVLAYDHGLSQSEIADRLGLPIGTVKSRTRRALAALRDRLSNVPDLWPAAIGTDPR